MAGNRRLYARLLGDFARNYAGSSAEVEAAIDESDWNRAQGMIHSLKGVAGNLGAMKLCEAAAALETAVRAPKPDVARARSKLAALDRRLKQAVASAQLLSGEEGVAKGGRSDSAPLAPALARETAVRLREAVNMGDVMAVSSVAANLPPESPYASRIRDLSEILDLEGLEALADDMEQAAGAKI